MASLMTPPMTTWAFGIACGFFIHHVIFIHGEWHIEAPHIVLTHISIVVCLDLLNRSMQDTASLAIVQIISSAFWGYLPGIVLSIILYRVFFHRLTRAKFPGPWYAPLSKIWHVWAARQGQNHLVLHSLHKKYGDVVRTGPAEVTVFTPDAFIVIDGPRSECIKSEFYDLLKGIGYPSLVNTRHGPTHAIRRREWRPGFSSQSLQLHSTKISPHIEQLSKLIEDDIRHNRVSSIRDYMYWFGFDAMGEFVFSKSFGMLREKKPSPIIERLQSALSILGPLTPVPWLLHVGLRMAPRISVVKDWFDTLDWCRDQMQDRLSVSGSKGPASVGGDLAYYLMEDGHNRNAGITEGRDWNMAWLTGDSLLAIVAGSDPTTVTLIGAFAEMAKHPEQAEKIFEEVVDLDETDFRSLATLPHLNAVIKEVMRLYPSLLSGGSRKTLENSVVIGGKLIPPHTTIVCPRYTINRREDCFERPLDFVPERWTTRPEMIRNRGGYTPFGTGSRSCLGRYLAEDMMRSVTARIVKRYRFHLAPGETGNRVLDEVSDQFVPNPGPLVLIFEHRKL